MARSSTRLSGQWGLDSEQEQQQSWWCWRAKRTVAIGSSPKKWRPADRVSRLHVGAVIYEQLDRLLGTRRPGRLGRLVGGHGQQWCTAVPVLGVDPRALLEEHLDSLPGAPDAGHEQGRLAVAVAPLQVRAACQELPHDGNLSGLRRTEQGRQVIVGPGLDIGAILEEEADDG